MFQSMKNIQSAFNYVRLFTIIICICAFGVAIYSVSKISEMALIAKHQMLTIDKDGNLYNGLSSTRESNIEIEGRAHVYSFHQLFFAFDPERAVINDHKTKWNYLADKSAVVQFDQLEEAGFFQNIIVSSISSRLEDVDIEIENDEGSSYLIFSFSAKQKLMRSSSISYRNLKTTGRLRILENRSKNNPHALMIENWKIIDNSTIN
jgi:conjugative transposon TraK protein